FPRRGAAAGERHAAVHLAEAEVLRQPGAFFVGVGQPVEAVDPLGAAPGEGPPQRVGVRPRVVGAGDAAAEELTVPGEEAAGRRSHRVALRRGWRSGPRSWAGPASESASAPGTRP